MRRGRCVPEGSGLAWIPPALGATAVSPPAVAVGDEVQPGGGVARAPEHGGTTDPPMDAALRTRLEQLLAGVQLTGLTATGAVDVVAVRWGRRGKK